MQRNRILVFLAIVIALAGIAWTARYLTAEHDHLWVQVTTPQGEVYWTCPMHPQVRQSSPGNCPICGMKLVKRNDPGRTVAQPAKPGETAQKSGRRILYWYDPMRPDVHFDKPGKSPFMDMQLVPKYADEAAADTIEIDPRVVQKLGMRTTPVVRGTLGAGTEVVGSVVVDERRIRVVEARATGWIEQLDVRAVGDPVRRGERVAAIYAPELLAAQSELVLAARSADQALIDAARQRLLLLGVSAGQIGQVLSTGQAQRRVAVLAPSDGIVTELNVRAGQQVRPNEPMMRVADLSQVWISIAVPEAQAAIVRAGAGAQARLRALPGRVFEGRIEYVYPRLDPETRTLSARIALDNRELLLKPGMYADVTLSSEAARTVLLAPAESVIRTGARTVVILAEGEGRFRPAEVAIGAERGETIEILSGLREGERVVVSGQFLIDSEASLRGAFNRMGSAGDGDPPAGRVRLQGTGGGPSVIGQPNPDGGRPRVEPDGEQP